MMPRTIHRRLRPNSRCYENLHAVLTKKHADLAGKQVAFTRKHRFWTSNTPLWVFHAGMEKPFRRYTPWVAPGATDHQTEVSRRYNIRTPVPCLDANRRTRPVVRHRFRRRAPVVG